jgi:hypothetical protein
MDEPFQIKYLKFMRKDIIVNVKKLKVLTND